MSTTSDSNPSPRKLRPKNAPPSTRDQEIFQLAVLHHWTHLNIASQKGLTRRRVSQIVKRVRLWYAKHPTGDPLLSAELDRQRYSRALERLRLQDIIRRTVHALDSAPPALETTYSTDGGAVKRCLRDQPPVDVRLLRMYLRAVDALARLNSRPELPAPPPSNPTPSRPPLGNTAQPWLEPRIQEVVKAWQHHHYILTDEHLDKFAQELTLAFLGCLNPPDPSPPAGSASLVSLPSASESAPVAVQTGDPTPSAAVTSADSPSSAGAPPAPPTASEKTEKGSTTQKYRRPLHIGPLPMPTARRCAAHGAETQHEKQHPTSADVALESG